MITLARAPQIEWLDPLADSRWDRETDRHPAATIFHHGAWARLLARTYGHRPTYARLHAAGETRALVPLVEIDSRWTGRRGVGLPFSDFCEPLLFGGNGGPEPADPEESAAVRDALLPLARVRGWRHFELRGGPAPTSAAPTFLAHTIDLTGGRSAVCARVGKNARRARNSRRQAQRDDVRDDDVRVTIGRDAAAMQRFFGLHLLTRRRHGVPPQPLAFFENLWRELIAPGLGFIVAAERDRRPVAAAVFLRRGPHALYKFSASDRPLNVFRANDVVLWAGIQALVRSGAETLHLGRTAPGHAGLLRFKRGWATAETPLVYHRFDGRTGQPLAVPAPRPGLSPTLFRLLPSGINQLAGRLLYPHLD